MTMKAPDHVDAAIAELKAQVRGLNEADRKLESGLANLAETVAAGFRDLTTKIDARSVFPMPTFLFGISVILGIVGLVGGLARQPLADAITQNRGDIIAAAAIARQDNLTVRSRQDNLQSEVDYLRGRLDVVLGAVKRN